MIIEVDPRSPVPPYEQIRQQVVALVHGGLLPTGSRLPSIRQLANDLGLAGGTVARAYRELEAEGVVATRGRHGTTITATPEVDRRGDLLRAAKRYADHAAQAGAGLDEAIAALRAAFARGGDR